MRALLRTRDPVGHSNNPKQRLPFSDSDRLAAKAPSLNTKNTHSTHARFVPLTTRPHISPFEDVSATEVRDIGLGTEEHRWCRADFNEIVLDFLSEPDVVAQDSLKELVNASKLLQRERGPARSQKFSFDAFITELEDFHRMIHPESGALITKKRKQSHSGERRSKGIRTLRKSRPNQANPQPLVIPRSEPLSGLSTVTASLGAISRSCIDYPLQFDSCVVSSPPEAPTQDTSAASSNPPESKRLDPLVKCAEPTALPVLVRDLRAFASRVDVFRHRLCRGVIS
ncbi:hypothetical protein OG21DRAFT_1487791 [Imleria badia]|nr:hypothetical protein OG21DRAFT_1487791 [Imleria badia]